MVEAGARQISDRRKRSFTLAGLGLLIAATAAGVSGDWPSEGQVDSPFPVADSPSREWVRIGGRITSMSPDHLVLAHGGTSFVVETDLGNPLFQELSAIRIGDQAVVTGTRSRATASLPRRVRPMSIYLPRLNTYHYKADPGRRRGPVPVLADETGSSIQVSGVVESVRGAEIGLRTGGAMLALDILAAPAESVPTSIGIGDHLLVSGTLADGVERSRIVPTGIIRLRRAPAD